MKKLLSLLLTLLFTISFALPVFADYGADLSCAYSYTDEGKVCVRASLVNINDDDGIALLDYVIKYDSSALELESVKANMPSEWKQFVADEMAEDFSRPIDEGYVWNLLNSMPGYGVTEDDELYVELIFVPISEASTSIEFICKTVVNDNLIDVRGPDKTITIFPQNKDDTDLSTPESNVQSSEPVNSEHSESDVETSEDVAESDVEPSEEPSESDIESSEQPSENNSDDFESESDVVELPEEPVSENDEIIDNVQSDNDELVGGETQSNETDTDALNEDIESNENSTVKLFGKSLVWVLIIGGCIIVAISVGVFLLLNLKGKK